jgi:hypothetical protein
VAGGRASAHGRGGHGRRGHRARGDPAGRGQQLPGPGAPAAVSAGGEVCVHFVRDRVSDADEDEEDTESPDQRTFSGTRIDLRPLLTEQVLLSYPIRALCAHGEACRGLCMRCGAELNGQPEGPCAACGAADAQVPIASDADLEAAAEKPTTSWQAALQQLAGAAGQGRGTGLDNLPAEAAIPGEDDVFDPGFDRGLGLEPEGAPERLASRVGKASGRSSGKSGAGSGKSSHRKKH